MLYLLFYITCRFSHMPLFFMFLFMKFLCLKWALHLVKHFSWFSAGSVTSNNILLTPLSLDCALWKHKFTCLKTLKYIIFKWSDHMPFFPLGVSGRFDRFSVVIWTSQRPCFGNLNWEFKKDIVVLWMTRYEVYTQELSTDMLFTMLVSKIEETNLQGKNSALKNPLIKPRCIYWLHWVAGDTSTTL